MASPSSPVVTFSPDPGNPVGSNLDVSLEAQGAPSHVQIDLEAVEEPNKVNLLWVQTRAGSQSVKLSTQHKTKAQDLVTRFKVELNTVDAALNPGRASAIEWFDYDISTQQIKYKRIGADAIHFLQFDPANAQHAPLLQLVDEVKDFHKDVYGTYPDYIRYDKGVVAFHGGPRAFHKLETANFSQKTFGKQSFDDGVERAKACFTRRNVLPGIDPDLTPAQQADIERVKNNVMAFKRDLNHSVTQLAAIPQTDVNYAKAQQRIAAIKAQIEELEIGATGFALTMAVLYKQKDANGRPVPHDSASIKAAQKEIADAIVKYSKEHDGGLTTKVTRVFEKTAQKIEREKQREKDANVMAADIAGLLYGLTADTEQNEIQAQFEYRQACAEWGTASPGDRLALHKNIAHFVNRDRNAALEEIDDINKYRTLLASSLKFNDKNAFDQQILNDIFAPPAPPI